jgi:hypothetical protein
MNNINITRNIQCKYDILTHVRTQVCVHPSEGSSFPEIPARFEEGSNVLTRGEWYDVLAGYSNYPKSFQACIPFLLAQLCHQFAPRLSASRSDSTVGLIERECTPETILGSCCIQPKHRTILHASAFFESCWDF